MEPTTHDMSQYTAVPVNVNEVWSDDDFNCRGSISPFSVQELADDIKLNTLQFPIAVQPIEDVADYKPEGKKWRIIAGHRRFKAVQLLKWDTVPAMIKSGLTELQALVYNLNENIKREELNILQESHALKRMKDLGMGQEDAAIAVGKKRSWIQVRYTLLELPEVIQQEAAAGVLNQQQIKQIYSLGSDEERFAAVRKIKTLRDNGLKSVSVAKKPQDDPYKKKRRAVNEMQEMIQHIGKESPIGFGLATVAMAWCAGEVCSSDLFLSIYDEAKKLGKFYMVPVPELSKVLSERPPQLVALPQVISDFQD